MIWADSLGAFEYITILLFSIFYLSYAVRMVRAARILESPVRSIIWKFLLRSAYFVLIIIALLGPSFGDATREIKSVGKDIFFCIDLSQSMNAHDIQPNRLAKVKFELKNIIEAFNSDRKGIIMFSNEAFMQCPLTYDNNALNLFLQTMNTSLVPNTGTDFAPPLEMALDKLVDKEDGGEEKSKIIILISDGEDFGDDTEEMAEKIESSGIKLFALGVGTSRGSKIRTHRGFKTDRQGEEVVSKLNASSLKKLASDTGGKYFEINSKNNDVSRMINTINLIEGELRDSKQVDAKANKYYYFLGLALVLILLDILITIRVLRI
ncbi:MAG: VWA domain-containing protein [Cyclobacteriaceae bacterium]